MAENLSLLAVKRPTVQVIQFGDYDHTGWNNEFYMQTESIPCGKSAGFVVGVSKTNPRLHTLGTAASPERPLSLKRNEWEALRQGSGPVDVQDWGCGDHGAETETRLTLRWTGKSIEGSQREYTCPPDPRKLIHEEPL